MTNWKKLRARTISRHFQNQKTRNKSSARFSVAIILLALAYCVLALDLKLITSGQSELYELVDRSAQSVLAGQWLPNRYR